MKDVAEPNDWKITLFKFGEIIFFGALGSLIVYLTGLPEGATVVACIAILKALENYLKHR